MPRYLNKAMIIGNLGQDPEQRVLPSGDTFTTFSIATTRRWTNQQTNETREQTEWHNIVVRKTSSLTFTEQYLKKGMLVYVEGKLRSRSYKSKTGDDRTVLEVFAEDVQLLSNTKKEESVPTNTEMVEETEF